jgi:hypothetical protein
MDGPMSPTPLDLSPAARRAFDRLAADLQRALGDRFVALVAYAPTRSAAFCRQIAADDLQALAPLADRWHREGLDPPLLVTPHEFQRSLDAFPLEYDAILDRHVLIAGTMPFGEARPSETDIRRACEVQAQAFLIHLRQGWLQAADHHDEQVTLLQQSGAPLRTLLVTLARLDQSPHSNDGELVTFGANRIGLPTEVLRGVLQLEATPDLAPGLLAEPGFMNAYLQAAETLWSYVDAWRA